LTEQGKSKKLKGKRKKKKNGHRATKFIYGDYLFTFYFLLLNVGVIL